MEDMRRLWTSKEKNKSLRYRKIRFLCLLMLVFSLLTATGCESGEISYLSDAAACYKEENYKDAETYFIRAIRNGEKSLTVYSGYAFNQLKLGDLEGAKALFNLIMNQNYTYGNYFDSEPATGDAVRLGLLQIYLAENNYEEAVILLNELGENTSDKKKSDRYKYAAATLAFRVYDENVLRSDDENAKSPFSEDYILKLLSDSIESGNEDIDMYLMRSDLYWVKGEKELWEADLRKVIELKEYAMEEYNAIYGMYLADEERNDKDVLRLVDETEIYLKGHAAYIDDYSKIIPMVLKAADLATHVEWEHDPDHYFGLAEEYIKAAEDKNASDDQLLKYQIIVAERKGKMELAYKLLGVYLEHCPDDRMAYKEQKYLENRLGFSKD